MRELFLPDLAEMDRDTAETSIRSRVQTVYLGEGRVLTRVLGRQKMYLSAGDLGFAGNVMLDGYWEIWLTLFFARVVQPGMTVIDIGANFGYYTILFGDAVGAEGRVLAVEPVPATADLLTRTVALNGHAKRTTIYRMALGRGASGEVHMRVPENEPKNATVVASRSPSTITVGATNVDALTHDLDRVDLIKIDAEGAEREIFYGMKETIARHKPQVLLEFNAARYRDADKFLAEIRTQFQRIRALDFDGNLQEVGDAELLGMNVGEDRLLFLEVRNAR